MTLNDLERRNSPYFAFSYRIRLLCWPIIYITVVEERPVMSAKYCLPRSSLLAYFCKTNPSWSTVLRFLCDSWATCLAPSTFAVESYNNRTDVKSDIRHWSRLPVSEQADVWQGVATLQERLASFLTSPPSDMRYAEISAKRAQWLNWPYARVYLLTDLSTRPRTPRFRHVR